MKLAPIVIFTYNRPWHTQQTVEALLKNEYASESDLIIFSDAPKNEAAKKGQGKNSAKFYPKEDFSMRKNLYTKTINGRFVQGL